MRSPILWCASLLVIVPAVALGQTTKLSLQQAIEAKYAVSKPTADRTDIVTAGAVIDLTKDGLIMYGTDAKVASNETYKNGKFEASGAAKFQNFSNRFAKLGNSEASSNRTFVAGEKFFLIGVDVKDDGAVLEFMSDPISDLRYKVFVKYPFAKGAIPAPDVLLGEIAQTIKAEPMDNQQGGGDQGAQQQQQAPAAPAGPAATPMAAIPPPPPPTDAPAAAPQSISLGQTKDQVVAMMGPPTKVANLGTKEIDTYPDLKVTYIKGKVTDVQ